MVVGAEASFDERSISFRAGWGESSFSCSATSSHSAATYGGGRSPAEEKRRKKAHLYGRPAAPRRFAGFLRRPALLGA